MRKLATNASLAICCLMLLGASSWAADPDLRVWRSSDIVGMKVRNSAGQDLGKVEDLVIDVNSGKVRYAAVSFGGFLGVGDKLFAVPFSAFKTHYNASDNAKHFVLNVEKKALEAAQGFDKKNWPDFGDPKWGADYDKHFLDPTTTR